MSTRLACVLAILASTGCSDGVCSPDELTRALAGAEAGDVVTVGSCEVRGAFTVPAGVTLRGASDASALGSVEGGAPVLELAGDAARVEDLRILVDHGGYGARAVGASGLELSRVRVTVTRGIGLGFRESEASLVAIDLEGPITAANAATAPDDPATTGAFGLAALGSTLHLEALTARGFALSALAIEGGTLEWIDDDELVDVDATLGTGVGLFGVSATLSGVELGGMLAGFDRPGFALVAGLDDAGTPTTLSATDVRIASGAGYGVLGDGSDITLTRVTIEDLGLVGIHAQQGGSIHASDVTVRRNGGAGLVALDLDEIVLERASFSEQRTVSLAHGASTVRAADGVHVRRTDPSAPAIDLRASDLTLENNERVGLLLDADDTAPARVELTNVRVAADTGAALGAVAQRTTLPTDWDADVVREGVTLGNDAAFPGGIDLVGLLMPPALVAHPPMP